MTTVVVFGGTGFLGRRLVHRLAVEGAIVRVAVRRPDGAQSALSAADLDHVTFHLRLEEVAHRQEERGHERRLNISRSARE